MPKKLSLAKVAAKPAWRVTPLLADVRGLIIGAREQVARAVDSGLVALYWHIGRRVHQDILKEKRAEYGAKIVSVMGTQLNREFGCGFNARNLFRMVRFAEIFPVSKIVHALRAQLGWTHFESISSRRSSNLSNSRGVPIVANSPQLGPGELGHGGILNPSNSTGLNIPANAAFHH